jgi:hypothetical protein
VSLDRYQLLIGFETTALKRLAIGVAQGITNGSSIIAIIALEPLVRSFFSLVEGL